MKQNNHLSEQVVTTESIGMKENKNQSGQYFNKESVLADFRLGDGGRTYRAD